MCYYQEKFNRMNYIIKRKEYISKAWSDGQSTKKSPFFKFKLYAR